MSDNNNLPQKKDSAELALHKTRSLLSITNKILANRANRTLVVSDDAWLDELIAWAVENDFPEKQFPRDKQAILALTELHLGPWVSELTRLPESIGKLTNLTMLYLCDNPIKSLSAQHSHLSPITIFD